ncbi:hypothetical protein JUN65_04895 [Gluconacetobacter azotocaptans]|uniref:hypothetical protein n=1 Tax=Gluconacetobacter azotocaptans TaxID=142834 RepID=UPI00195AFD70|nr:hypothetical protein [Gluconacetobacter azotocaptans]MBM9400921.1 hypothetical protein [Gluconacetobacter azotocaptans]
MKHDPAWPDPEHVGIPRNPDTSGPHALLDPQGEKIWGWWEAHRRLWVLSRWRQKHAGPAMAAWHYLGPARWPETDGVSEGDSA